jgi:4-hydroxy-tetrahydrodipicolinate synthase
MEPGRLLTAMATPFDAQGKVDYEQAKRLALALLDSGSDGLLIAGTTGESPTLTHEEKLRLFAEVKQAVGNRGTVIAGTGTYNTAESIELSREAERVGVDGVLLTTPYYSKPPQEGIYRHFEAIAGAVSTPCILYNIPGRTGVNVTAETMVRLAQMPIMAVGGYGAVAVTSHLVGVQIREMIEAHLAGRADQAAQIHRRLLPLVSVLMSPPGNPICLKYALNSIGFKVGGYRLPLVEPDAATAERITAEVRRQRIDLAVAV